MREWSANEGRRELAIRVDVGARGSTLTAMVLRRALVLAAIGIAGGLLGARAATGVLTGLLYGVRPTDPSAFALTGVLVAIVSLAACYVPVRRAIRVDPVSLLR